MSVAQVSPDVTFTVAQGFLFLGIVVMVALVACVAFIVEGWDDRKFDREVGR